MTTSVPPREPAAVPAVPAVPVDPAAPVGPALRQPAGLSAAERHGLRLPARLVLVLVVQALVALWLLIGWSNADIGPGFYLLLFPAFWLGLAVTVQAHHRLPMAWHVLVVIVGYLASFAQTALGAFVLGDQTAGTFDRWYWTSLGWASLVVVELSCLLALARPAGSSYVTRQRIANAGAS